MPPSSKEGKYSGIAALMSCAKLPVPATDAWFMPSMVIESPMKIQLSWTPALASWTSMLNATSMFIGEPSDTVT